MEERSKMQSEVADILEKAKAGEEITLPKDSSLKITKSIDFGTTKGDLRVYNEDLTMKEFDDYPRISVTAAEELNKFQYGVIRIDIQDSENELKRSYLIQVDGLLSIVYSVYAKTLNSLRKPTFRQHAVRIHGFIRKFIDKIKGK